MKSFLALNIAVLSATFLLTPPKLAASQYVPMWAEGACSSDVNHGANRDFYNGATDFRWQNYLGDWTDTAGVKQGALSYAEAPVQDLDQSQVVSFDATELVQQWVSKTFHNQGLLLKNLYSGSGTIYSKEAQDSADFPTLEISTNNGFYTLVAASDTAIRKSTFKCAGEETELDYSSNILLHFNLESIPANSVVYSANLRVTTSDSQRGNALLQMFRIDIETKDFGDGRLSSKYPNDYELRYDSDVVLVESFESDNWLDKWSTIDHENNIQVVTANESEGFQSLSGKALQVRLTKGTLNGFKVQYLFAHEGEEEPEELYLRYYVMFGNSWTTNDSGKLPGIAGTYSGTPLEGGWGGRRSTGQNGWSLRGRFDIEAQGNNPFAGQVPVGNYIYHANQSSTFGDALIFNGSNPSAFKKGVWYSVEQHVKMNTPGLNDGVVKTWVDGVLAFEKNDFMFRDQYSEEIKIDRVWVNLFHGGTTAIENDAYAFFDNIVIAKTRIGPTQFHANLPKVGDEINRPPSIGYYYPHQQEVDVKAFTQQNFTISVEDQERDPLSIKWYINGELYAEDTESIDYNRALTDRHAGLVEVKITDQMQRVVSQSWVISDISEDWVRHTTIKDTYLTSSTFTAKGFVDTIKIDTDSNAYLGFDLSSQDVQGNRVFLAMFAKSQIGDTELEIYFGDNQWAEGIDSKTGATRQYRDFQSKQEWQNYLGDWVDSASVANGNVPYVSALITDKNQPTWEVIDVTELIEKQQDLANLVLVLKSRSGRNVIYSKEYADNEFHPQLLIERTK